MGSFIAAVSVAPTASAAPAGAANPVPTGELSWGDGSNGQLGNGIAIGTQTTPVGVHLPSGVAPTAVAAGLSAAYAIGSDGHLYAWGGGDYGALGNGTTYGSYTPVGVNLPVGVTPTAIAAGDSTGYAIGSDGHLYAWGLGNDGELGNGTTNEAYTPVGVNLPSGVTPTQVAAGCSTGYAIGSDGHLYAWGYGGGGQLGNGTTTPYQSTPVTVSLPSGVTPTAVAAGCNTGYAIGSDGHLYAWGSGDYGQLGNDSTTSTQTTPVEVSLPSGVTPTAIAAGSSTGYAIGSDGHLYAWGLGNGLLGNGTTTLRQTTPVEVSLPSGVTPTAIAAGADTGYAIGSDGHLYAWGSGVDGELGNGTTTLRQTTPVEVSLPSGVMPTALGPESDSFAGYALVGAVPGPYSPLRPTRICDTRANNPSGLSGNAAQCNGTANSGSQLAVGGTLTISVGGQFSVPTDASAVVLNVTAVNLWSPGYLTVFPTGQSRPTASNLDYAADQVVANLVEVGLGTSGQISFYSSAATNVVVDLEGYVDSSSSLGRGGGLYHALSSPARICDTRAGNPSGLSGSAAQCNAKTLSAGSTLGVQVGGVGGVPASGVVAVVLNATTVHPGGPGYLTVFPSGSIRPAASNVNYRAGQVVPNRVIVPVSSSGKIEVYSSAATDVVLDVSGWYSSAGGSTGSTFSAEMAPTRICDTRAGNPSGLSGGAAQCNAKTLTAGTTMRVHVTGLAGVPSGASAVVLNVTAVRPTQNTYLTVFPSGNSPPMVSDLNPSVGEVEGNLVVATLSSRGTIEIYNNSGSVNVVVDLLGWYSS